MPEDARATVAGDAAAPSTHASRGPDVTPAVAPIETVGSPAQVALGELSFAGPGDVSPAAGAVSRLSPQIMLALQRSAGNVAARSLVARRTVQRDGPGTPGATATPGAATPGAATPAVDNVHALDEQLGKIFTDHREVLNILGRMTPTEKRTITAGYRDRLAHLFHFNEMKEAVVTLGLDLPTKLDWLDKTALLTSGINYNEIQAFVTSAPQTERDMLKNARWRSFFVSVCTNQTIFTAVNDLGFDLVTKLEWIRTEASALLSLNYAQIQPLITAAPQADRDRLKTADWKSFFLDVCTNRTIFTAVNDLAFDLVTKLEWIRAEASARFSLTYADIEPLIRGASATDRAAITTDAWLSFWTDLCTNATMAQAVDVLFPDNLRKKLEWMAEEGSSLPLVNAKVTATADLAQKLAVFDSGKVTAMMVSLCSKPEFTTFLFSLGGDWWKWRGWALAKAVGFKDLAIAAVAQGAIPAASIPAGFIRVVQTPGTVDAARLYVRNLSDSDLALLNAHPMTLDVVNDAFGTGADPILRALAGEISSTDQKVSTNETLLAGPTTGPFTAMNFGGDHRYTLTYRRDGIDVDVAVALTAASGDTRAASLLPAAITTWRGNIEGAWNGKFRLTNGQRTIPMRFHANLGSSGPNAVTAHSGRWAWPNLNAGNWFVPDSAIPDQQSAVSTAPIHEFGHLIGNLDEYSIGAAHYLAVVGTSPVTDPNAVPETDTAGTTRYTNSLSVMGTGTTILQRHVQGILTQVNANLRPGEPPFSFAP